MHIPDGFLDGRTAAISAGLSAVALGFAVRQSQRHLPQRKVPLMGLSAAFVFAAQMLNFPVAGGTSGHMIGGVLCAALLGPSAAILVISCVLIVQCFVFADGGVLALGANILNMAVISSVGGYYVYAGAQKLLPGPRGRLAAVAFASWISTVAAAIVCAGELALSGTVPWSVAYPAMAGVHMLIGIGEALITTLVIHSISQARPELLVLRNQTEPRRYGEVLIFGTLIALGLAMFVSPFACPWPDGLDHVAEKLGFAALEAKHRLIPAPIPDYQMPGVGSLGLATTLAGGLGTIVVFGLAIMLAKVLTPATAEPAFETPGNGL